MGVGIGLKPPADSSELHFIQETSTFPKVWDELQGGEHIKYFLMSLLVWTLTSAEDDGTGERHSLTLQSCYSSRGEPDQS